MPSNFTTSYKREYLQNEASYRNIFLKNLVNYHTNSSIPQKPYYAIDLKHKINPALEK